MSTAIPHQKGEQAVGIYEEAGSQAMLSSNDPARKTEGMRVWRCDGHNDTVHGSRRVKTIHPRGSIGRWQIGRCRDTVWCGTNSVPAGEGIVERIRGWSEWRVLNDLQTSSWIVHVLGIRIIT